MKKLRYVAALLLAVVLSVGLTGVRALADEDDAAGKNATGSLAVKVVSLDQVEAGKQYVLLADHIDCGRVFAVQSDATLAVAKTSSLAPDVKLALPDGTATWSIAKNDDGNYVVGSDGFYLSLAEGELFSSSEAAIAFESSGAGYVLSGDSAYVGVTTKGGQHQIAAVDSEKASVVYVAEVIEPEPEPEPEQLNTNVQVPALLPSEGFSATITTPNKVYSSYEYVIFTKNADGEYVAIDREGTASAPLGVSGLAYGKRLTSPDNDVTWRVIAHDNLDNKMVKYVSNVANDLLLTAHAPKGVLTADASKSDYRFVFADGDLSAKLRTDDSGVYLTLGEDGFGTTQNESEAADFYFAVVQNEEGDPSVVKKGHVLKVVDWADVAKDGSRQYAIVNAAEFNYQHMPLNSIGRFPDTGVKILTQDICPADSAPVNGVPMGSDFCDVVAGDVVYAYDDDIFWTVSAVDGGAQIQNATTGVYLNVQDNDGPLNKRAISASDDSTVAVEPIEGTPVVYIGNGSDYMSIAGYRAVTDDRAKNPNDTYFFAEVIDEADLPAENLPAGDKDTYYFGGIYSTYQSSAHSISDGTVVSNYILMKPQDQASTFRPSENDYTVGFCVDAEGDIWGNMDPLAKYEAVSSDDYEKYLSKDGQAAVAAMVLNAYPNVPLDYLLGTIRDAGYELSDGCGTDELLAGLQCAIYTYTDPREDGSAWGYEDTSMRMHAQLEADKAESIVADRDAAASDVNSIRDFYLAIAKKAASSVPDEGPAGAGVRRSLKAEPTQDANGGEDKYSLESLDMTAKPSGDGKYTVTVNGKLNKALVGPKNPWQESGYGYEVPYSEAIVYAAISDESGKVLGSAKCNSAIEGERIDSFTITVEGVSADEELTVSVNYSIADGIVKFITSVPLEGEAPDQQYQRLVIVDGDNDFYSDVAKISALSVSKQWVHEEDLSHGPITLELLDNGEPTGQEIELSSDNNWTGSFPMVLGPVKRVVYGNDEEGYPSASPYVDGTTLPHDYTVAEKGGSAGAYICETVPAKLEKINGIPTEAGTYVMYVTNGDYAGYVLPSGKVPPIKCSVDELAQLPLKTYGTPVSDEDLQYLSQEFETGDDGAVYIKSYRDDGKYIKIQNKNGYLYFNYEASKDEATAISFYKYVPMVVRNVPATSVTVKKVWDDSDDKDGKRPESITVTLSNGDEVTLSGENDWTATIDGLPRYDEGGREIEYSWTEAGCPGYELTGTEVEGTVTTLTNTAVPPEGPTPEDPRPEGPTPGEPATSAPRPQRPAVRRAMPSTGDAAGGLAAPLLGAGLACLAAAGAARRRAR